MDLRFKHLFSFYLGKNSFIIPTSISATCYFHQHRPASKSDPSYKSSFY